MRQLLDRAARSVGTGSSVAREPAVEGAIRSTIGNAYLGLGLYGEAAEQLHWAGNLLEEAGAPAEDILFARNRAFLARAMTGEGIMLEVLNRTFKECVDRLGREHPETVYAADNLAQLYRTRPQAVPLLRENLEIQRRRHGADHQLALRAVSNLVIALEYSQDDADLAEADSLARESCELWVRKHGPEFPETLFALTERGHILAMRGKLEESRSVLAPLPDAIARALGPDHFQRSMASRSYGLTLEALGDLDGAEAQYRQSLAILSKGLAGRRDRYRLKAALHAGLARVELTRGREAVALELLLPILRAHTRPRPLTVPADRLAGAFADALGDRGDPKVSVELLEAMRDDTDRLDSRLDWLRPHLQSLLGGYRLRLGDRNAAAADLRAAIERMERSHLKPPASVLAAARARLARLDAADVKGQAPSPGR